MPLKLQDQNGGVTLLPSQYHIGQILSSQIAIKQHKIEDIIKAYSTKNDIFLLLQIPTNKIV